MKSIRTLFFLVGLIVAPFWFAAQAETGAEESSAETVDIYIPTDLEDCFSELNKHLRPEDVKKIKSGEITSTDMHFGLGMGLRNRWGLWGGSRLAKYFNSLGIHHPDDMSGIILESYVRKLSGKPIQLEEQIEFYQKYWEKAEKAEDENDKEK